MELAGEDGSRVELKEGHALVLGRVYGLSHHDGSVSRHQVVVELSRPSSRKGKEVVGQSLNLKLQIQNVGRNPICVVNQGRKDNDKSQVKFLCNGQKDWLIVGDKISLSIKRPFFYELRFEGRSTPNSGKATLNTKANSNGVGSAPDEKNEEHVKFAAMDEEEGIAEAVARRQRRKLEREKAAGNSSYGHQYRPEIVGPKKDGIAWTTEETKVARTEQQNVQHAPRVEKCEQLVKKENEVIHPQRDRSIHSVDPVTEFGFIVEGSEFSAYDKQSKANKSLWRPEIGQNKGIEDDCSDDEQMTSGGAGNNGRIGVRKPHILDYELESGRDTIAQQDRLKIGAQRKGSTRMATRKNRLKSTTSQGDNEGPRVKPLEKNREDSEEYSDDSAGSLEGFIVDDEDPVKEEEEEEDDEVDEYYLGASRKVRKEPAGQSQKPECKYGSKCYRKNAEHRAQFYHPSA